jgi:guanylate kinase
MNVVCQLTPQGQALVNISHALVLSASVTTRKDRVIKTGGIDFFFSFFEGASNAIIT